MFFGVFAHVFFGFSHCWFFREKLLTISCCFMRGYKLKPPADYQGTKASIDKAELGLGNGENPWIDGLGFNTMFFNTWLWENADMCGFFMLLENERHNRLFFKAAFFRKDYIIGIGVLLVWFILFSWICLWFISFQLNLPMFSLCLLPDFSSWFTVVYLHRR